MPNHPAPSLATARALLPPAPPAPAARSRRQWNVSPRCPGGAGGGRGERNAGLDGDILFFRANSDVPRPRARGLAHPPPPPCHVCFTLASSSHRLVADGQQRQQQRGGRVRRHGVWQLGFGRKGRNALFSARCRQARAREQAGRGGGKGAGARWKTGTGGVDVFYHFQNNQPLPPLFFSPCPPPHPHQRHLKHERLARVVGHLAPGGKGGGLGQGFGKGAVCRARGQQGAPLAARAHAGDDGGEAGNDVRGALRRRRRGGRVLEGEEGGGGEGERSTHTPLSPHSPPQTETGPPARPPAETTPPPRWRK